jgi:RimJ/RimL family protein N-acetyltransferase
MRLRAVALQGVLVRLEPLEARHFDETVEAALSAPAIWTHIPYPVRDRADIQRLFAVAQSMHAAESGIAYATCIGADRRLVGGTSIFLVNPETPSVEIGGTWIVPASQRTRVNTEAKLLQLTHCFEALKIARVELKTDALNLRSQEAMRRIGATYEGTFRRHMRRADGSLRDSAYFSIVADEWPSVKSRLDGLLSAYA